MSSNWTSGQFEDLTPWELLANWSAPVRPISQDMSVRTATERVHPARTEAFDRILSNHLVYCIVGDNNNSNCVVHNTTKVLR